MAFNSDRAKAGIHTGLVLAANHFVEKMKQKIEQVNVPRKIGDATSIGSPVVQKEISYIDITIDLKEAPMAAAFEYGSGIHGKKGETYRIPKEGSTSFLAIPRERWTKYQPPPDVDPVVLPHVAHPGVAARPFIKPTIQEEREQIRKILGKEFVASISMRGHVEIIK